MTPERLRQIRHLFEAALERDRDGRTVFLSEACQGDQRLFVEVERLLAAHGGIGTISADGLLTDARRGGPVMEGRQVDHYEVLRELGRGGMGTVYLAVRSDDNERQPVAIKIARPGASGEEVQRFRQERDIVASLDHPNIARLLDSGTTPEGQPYFVMDYVEGQPIDVYCDARQLSVARRLALFRSVWAAVDYAHRHHVVHRDLKPSNILVTADGVVKLLDFGIAKLLRDNPGTVDTVVITRTGLRLMTPEYASPEQVRGDSVDTATDVYSLGVVLYELLTGHRPYRMRSRLIHEVVRVITEEEPTRPSAVIDEVEERPGLDAALPLLVTAQSVSRTRETTAVGLRRQLSGDIDRIVLKALRKDPRQRYRSISDFADDAQRHLDGLPVLARGQRLTYRVGTLLKRHATAFGSAALLLSGLATGAVTVNVFVATIAVILLVSLTGSYLLFRYQYGLDFARKSLPRTALLMVSVALMISVVRQFRSFEQALSLFTLVAAVVIAVKLARWPMRTRWAGTLLLNLTTARGRRMGWILGAIMAISAALSLVVAVYEPPARQPWYRLVLMVILTLYFVVCSGSVEIRDRGILAGDQFLRWPRIESYGWEQMGSGLIALKLQMRPLLPFLPRIRKIVVPAEHRGEVEGVLRKQFSEWPGRTIE